MGRRSVAYFDTGENLQQSCNLCYGIQFRSKQLVWLEKISWYPYPLSTSALNPYVALFKTRTDIHSTVLQGCVETSEPRDPCLGRMERYLEV